MYAIVNSHNILQGWMSGAGLVKLPKSDVQRGHRLVKLWQKDPGSDARKIGDDVSADIMSAEMVARNHSITGDECRTLGITR